jgi:hypothetical protein
MNGKTPQERQEAAMELLRAGDWAPLGLDMPAGLYARIAVAVVAGIPQKDSTLWEVARRFNDRAEQTDYWAQELGQE